MRRARCKMHALLCQKRSVRVSTVWGEGGHMPAKTCRSFGSSTARRVPGMRHARSRLRMACRHWNESATRTDGGSDTGPFRTGDKVQRPFADMLKGAWMHPYQDWN